MKRRKFLQQSGLLGAGFLLQQQLAKASFSRNFEPINVAIIGIGDRGRGLMEVMSELKDQFSLTAVCDVLDFRLQSALKANSNLVPQKDYKFILDNKSIKAVAIATPLNMHFQIASDALKAGKHVYLEKTMTYSIDEAIKLVKLSKQYPNQIFQVGHQYRYIPLCFKIKEMIEKGYLGKVTQIDCRWDRNWNWRRTVPAGYTDEQINWRMYKKYSGGLVAELLSHQIDFINWAFNTHPDEIMGTGGIDNFKDGRETYDNVQAILRYNKEGMIGNFGATCSNAREGYLFKIKGTKGMVSLLMDEGVFYPEDETKKQLQTVDGTTGATKLEWNKDGGIPIMKEKTKEGTWYALKEFHNSITNNTKPVSNVITGATTAICVHMANNAIYNHSIQDWKSDYNFA
jgi:predicted dehydrogenase